MIAWEVFDTYFLSQAEVAQVACKSACSHIAKSILEILVSEDLKQISMGALQQVNLDTIQCERELKQKLNKKKMKLKKY